jgi:hypothetical protein
MASIKVIARPFLPFRAVRPILADIIEIMEEYFFLPVNVRLQFIREVEIDHDLDIIDIDTSCGNVGGNQDVHTISLKREICEDDRSYFRRGNIDDIISYENVN